MSTVILIYKILFFGTCFILGPVCAIMAMITGPISAIYSDEQNGEKFIQDCIYWNKILWRVFIVGTCNFILLAIVFLIYRFV